MLRNYIHKRNFRESLKQYLGRYRYRPLESDDLRKVCEEVSGISLQQFFYQWIYTAGHPLPPRYRTITRQFTIERNYRQVLDEKSKDNGTQRRTRNQNFNI